MIFSPGLKSADNKIQTLGSLDIERVKSFTYLGFILNEKLSWNAHTDHRIKKSRQSLWLLRPLQKYLSTDSLNILCKALIEPIITYGLILYGSANAKNLQKLQIIQNHLARFACKAPKRYSATAAREKLNWLTMEQSYNLGVLCFMYKVSRLQVPDYTLELFKKPTAIHNHNTRTCTNNFYIEAGKTTKTLGKLSLKENSTRLWNMLPKNTKNCPTIKSFRENVITIIKLWP